MMTKALKQSEINRNWNLIDAKGQVLGRMAVKIADLLSGKYKVNYTPNIDNGDYVVVINAADFIVTGKKEDRKKYYHYTGYPGGLRSEKMRSLKAHKPADLIRRAVFGMLSPNRLRDRRISRLFIYQGAEHPHATQLGGKSAKN